MKKIGHALDDFVQFRADKRIFLLFSALNMCGYDLENNKKGMHPIRTKTRRELKSKHLSTITDLGRYFNKCDRNVSEFIVWALHYSDPPQLRRNQKDWFGRIAESCFAGFQDVLRDFYFEAGVEDLWGQCLPTYLEEIGRYEESTKKEINHMLGYLKLDKLPSERIIHIPNLLDSYWVGYGPKVGDNSYVVFGPTAGRTFLGLHEHLHPIVKPMLKKYAGKVRGTEHLYVKVKNKMNRYGYSTWAITVEECLIRALTIRLMKGVLPSMSTEDSIEREHKNGFIYVKDFYDRLASYEKSKKVFEQYLPTILEALEAF